MNTPLSRREALGMIAMAAGAASIGLPKAATAQDTPLKEHPKRRDVSVFRWKFSTNRVDRRLRDLSCHSADLGAGGYSQRPATSLDPRLLAH
jgi:hypothetical protein